MNLSMKWLGDYVKADMPIKDFCHALTMSGSKVECYEKEGSSISNVVVGKILSKGPHENADALFVCQVDIGAEAPIQIVTNAKNVKEGDLVPVALDGAVLPEGKIKKCKMRGVESFGMFCGLDTLGLTAHDFPYADPEGVFVIEEDCKPGDDIHTAIGLDDTSVEFEITSNRPDCLSVIGLARETAATYGTELKVKAPEFKGVDGDINSMLKVDIHNTEKCQRYCAGIVKNVKIGPSPRWMRERLRASGVRPINNFVDITNYVMLEYGQPMHAFDLRYVEGAHINVRNAKNGEKIMTLDGVERELTEDMLVIADEKKPVAVAGIMGGEYSGIMDDTTTVVFESAYFEPTQVRRTSKALKLKSDASSRYEKGVDRLISMTCLKRAFELVEELGAGEVLNTVIDCDYTDKTPASVEFSADWINNFLGTDISEADMIKYLERLEFKVENGKVIAPSFRIDIGCKADIAEEVARIYGYNNIPSTDFRGVARAEFTEEQKFVRTLRNAASALGGYEIATYSFVSPKYFDKIKLPADSKLRKVVRIVNPLGEDTSVMRTSTIPSMLDVLSFNYNNRNDKACLYEISKEYLPAEEEKPFINGDTLANSGKQKHMYKYSLPDEPQRLTIGMYGGDADFYTLKGMVEQILAELKIEDVEYLRAGDCDVFDEKYALHPGRSAVIIKDGKHLGIMGEVHPDVQETYEIGVKTYVAKLNIPELMEAAADKITYQPLPKFPATTRDLSLLVDEDMPVAELEKAIKGAVGKILEKVSLFDVYRSDEMKKNGKKSIAYSISMRSHEGTLTDEQADGAMKRVLKALSAIGAELRA
ncbi:phenylalanine--tRNA ligase subunit beta [Ruminococcus flavefaciens]|uniref:Phenylalanine--tRNA ligase beta subunit n=1 Tax=Ruminococcus flavefaciens TaxID=1265 RepID=A0A315XWW5_RUMFL|nr:phenylalanine--tRNA ligase subunit beta [Ruminococcus flavefaciens]PWJ11640.1 phenylalanyl-tRNA synthetase beta subunit [Ruminococcus flavefaciens]SSA50549.1 phenylalanyl-tRNA synthetase beta subunit [Ruminococcus flavefaciens]